MADPCASRGLHAVEPDDLGSWTRFDATLLEGQVPFGQDEAVAHAALLTQHAHDRGLAVAQKNMPQPSEEDSLQTVGFDAACELTGADAQRRCAFCWTGMCHGAQ